jgi:hypothetical protein
MTGFEPAISRCAILQKKLNFEFKFACYFYFGL